MSGACDGSTKALTRLRTYELDLHSPQAPTRPTGVDEKAVLTVLRVPPESEGMRLDRFVQSQLKRTSRTRSQMIVGKSAFAPDGRPHRSSDRVRAEQWICLWRPPWDEVHTDVELPILFEDGDLCAVDKPPMIPVHPTARYFRSTVVKLLAAVRPDERFYLAHRLDRETSGVLLLTKTKEADRHVKKQFAGLDPITGRPTGVRYVEKRYVAISRGEPRHDTFTIDEPLAPDDSSGLRVKMRTTRDGGQEAITICTVLERRRAAATGEPFAVVACDLLTGRQHQIRVHLASVGLPLVGDKLYGADDDVFRRGADGTLTDEDRARLGLERHALHAQRLSLLHPATGERTVFESPLPPDLARFLATLDP